MAASAQEFTEARGGFRPAHFLQGLAGLALFLCVLHVFGLLPSALVRLPETMNPPTAVWLDAIFNFVKGDMEAGRPGIIYVTRWFAEGPLEFMLNTTANLMEGKRRWPNLGPIPWTAITAVSVVIGFYLGGWRLALLAGGTFLWTALVGQWDLESAKSIGRQSSKEDAQEGRTKADNNRVQKTLTKLRWSDNNHIILANDLISPILGRVGIEELLRLSGPRGKEIYISFKRRPKARFAIRANNIFWRVSDRIRRTLEAGNSNPDERDHSDQRV